MLTLLKIRQIGSKTLVQCMTYSVLKDQEQKEPSKKTESNVPQTQKPYSLPATKYQPQSVKKTDLEWRTPWHQKEGQDLSLLRGMYTDHSHRSLLKLMQTRLDLSPDGIRKWWALKKETEAKMYQSYLPERHQRLGNELAAAHFIVHRGGAVKFYNENHWIKADDENNYDLPKFFDDSKILQAIDCSDMDLYYEGLGNFRQLKQVEWLSFNGVSQFDDWHLDKISNIFSHSLAYLDIRHCPKYTERGLGALYKMENLKILYLDDMLMTTPFEMTCLLLQEANPDLDIRIGDS